MCRWVDEFGNIIGDTHEPEASAAGRGGGGGTKKRSAADGGGGKRQKRSTNELLGGGAGSSGSDPQSLPAAAAGLAGGGEGAAAMDASAPEPPLAAVQPGSATAASAAAAAAAMGVLSGKGASPNKVLDTYTAFNLAAVQQQQPGWGLPAVPLSAPHLSIVGLRVNAMPSSLLPPPAQVRPAPCFVASCTLVDLRAAGIGLSIRMLALLCLLVLTLDWAAPPPFCGCCRRAHCQRPLLWTPQAPWQRQQQPLASTPLHSLPP
jgi:hypothetical protein